jgi:hypothetical protein
MKVWKMVKKILAFLGTLPFFLISAGFMRLSVTDHPKGATHVRPKGATGKVVF